MSNLLYVLPAEGFPSPQRIVIIVCWDSGRAMKSMDVEELVHESTVAVVAPCCEIQRASIEYVCNLLNACTLYIGSKTEQWHEG